MEGSIVSWIKRVDYLLRLITRGQRVYISVIMETVCNLSGDVHVGALNFKIFRDALEV